MKIHVIMQCGLGCRHPIHMTLPVDEVPCPEGHPHQHVLETERGKRMAALGMTVHAKAVHGVVE